MTLHSVDLASRGTPGPTLSVVLPMRNESRGLDRLFARLVPVLQATGLPFEDGTFDALREDFLGRYYASARARG